MNNTILESGITTLTRPVGVQEFSFDDFTRKMELVNFFAYCRSFNLLPVGGDYSRLFLIRLTYNHLLGASHTTSQAAELAWLQLQTSSLLSSREALWKLYFSQHAIVADVQGLTYGGLSLEAAYRKFLAEYVGEIFTFDESAFITELLTFRLSRVYQDSSTVSDVVTFLRQMFRQFSDSCSASDTVAILINRSFSDNSASLDNITMSMNRTFFDSVNVSDTFTFTGGAAQDENSLFTSEGASVNETISLSFIKVVADLTTVVDSISLETSVTFSDQCNVSSSLSFILGGILDVNEVSSNEDVYLILMNKSFFETINVTEDVITGYVGFNAGRFGSYYFGA